MTGHAEMLQELPAALRAAPGLICSRSLIAYNGADAGLGNRLRVTLGARNLAEAEGRKFFYVWPVGPAFGPRLSQLWEWEDGQEVPRSLSRGLAPLAPFHGHDWHRITPEMRRKKLWQVRTGAELDVPGGVRSWREDFRTMRPVPEIAERVRQLHDGHVAGRPYIGVMVRAHAVSHAKTRAASPVEWFEDRLLDLARRCPDVPIYVSCDVPEVQDRLVRSTPGAFGQTDKGEYNSVAGVRSAVVDLYLLAGAFHLLRPLHSSFVEMAHILAGETPTLEDSSGAAPPSLDLATADLAPDPLRPSLRRGADAH